ncbi:MAG: protein translocase subunit SecF, partial [Hyphomicrobiales bacterium]|nr:protein translocase subunit SecF [Hyphomicrobiales bacterium]
MKLLRLAPEDTKFGFMRFRRVSYPLSAVLSIVAVALFLSLGMNFGIDFAGGTMVQLRAKAGAADIAELRATAERLKLGDVEVQSIGTPADALVRVGPQAQGGAVGADAAVAKLREALSAKYDFRGTESVGPRVSGELVQSGTLGIVVSILAVLTYLWLRFEWQFAV